MRKLLPMMLALALVVAGCGGKAPETPGSGSSNPSPSGQQQQQQQQQPAEVKPFGLVVGQGSDAVTLDPHKTNDQPSSRVMRQIYDTLVVQNEKSELLPGLATEWTKINDTTYEFRLREGVKFHNGETLKASDVKFSFERLINPETKAPGAFILSELAGVEIINDYTIRLTTKAPFGPILYHLGHGATAILNEKAVQEGGEDYGQNPVGTGPFKFVSWTTGSHIDLARHDGYWGEKAKADTLTMRAIKENSTRAIELETGALDIAYDLGPEDYDRLMADSKINVMLGDTFSVNYIGFNFQKAPFDKAEIRQAVNHAINVDEIVEHVLLKIGDKATGPLASLVWGYNPNLKGYDFNPEKSKELLTKAGFPNGFKTTIWTNDNPTRMKIAEVVQDQLSKVGIEVEVQVIEWSQYLEDTANGMHDMFVLGWGTVTGDADYGLYSLFHSGQHGSPGNRTFYSNPEVDKLLDAGRNSLDEKVRLDAYTKAQELITADAPWLFLNETKEFSATKKSVENFIMHPDRSHRLANVLKK